ncbi:hypothetical protein AAFF_G00000330 [Aldrovandia affinis]|uniref:Uncharacterized protein n=1 Tax=Aldrovandia affinis TaxID=143900 RepID=A0AAD7TCN1_9TELE|nr:hypothetical protein AAFF_G00000330 [Aldrovandia affinis]
MRKALLFWRTREAGLMDVLVIAGGVPWDSPARQTHRRSPPVSHQEPAVPAEMHRRPARRGEHLPSSSRSRNYRQVNGTRSF